MPPAMRPSRGIATTACGRCSATSWGRTRPMTPGSSSASRSRPSSGRGTATAPGRTASGKGSPTTPAPASPSRRWSSATAVRMSATGVVFTRNPATGEAGLYGDVMFGAQGEDVVAGTHRTEPLASLDQRLPAVAAELRRDGRPPGGLLPRPVRHRVHHRGGPPVAPPGARRQAEPAGRAADGPRDGARRAVPAVAPRGRRAGRAAAGRAAARRDRPAPATPRRWRPGWPRRRAWPPARS